MKLARSLAPATAAAASPAPADEERRRTIREWVNIQRSRLVDELAQANCPWAEIDLDILNDLLALLQAPPAAPVRVTRKWLILLAQELDHALMDEVDSAYWGWGPVDRRLCSLGITVIDGEGEKK